MMEKRGKSAEGGSGEVGVEQEAAAKVLGHAMNLDGRNILVTEEAWFRISLKGGPCPPVVGAALRCALIIFLECRCNPLRGGSTAPKPTPTARRLEKRHWPSPPAPSANGPSGEVLLERVQGRWCPRQSSR